MPRARKQVDWKEMAFESLIYLPILLAYLYLMLGRLGFLLTYVHGHDTRFVYGLLAVCLMLGQAYLLELATSAAARIFRAAAT